MLFHPLPPPLKEVWASYILQNVYINLPPANIKVCVSYIEGDIGISKRCLFYHFLHLLCAEIIYSNPLFEVVNLLFGSV